MSVFIRRMCRWFSIVDSNKLRLVVSLDCLFSAVAALAPQLLPLCMSRCQPVFCYTINGHNGIGGETLQTYENTCRDNERYDNGMLPFGRGSGPL